MAGDAPEASPDGVRRRPRVAVVTHVFPPWTGGAEFYHQMLAEELSAQAEVRVFTADRVLKPGSQHGRTVVPRSESGAGTPYSVRYLPSLRFFGENLILPGPLFRALREFSPDVIWANLPSPSADAAVIFGMLRGVPWVATYHADLDEAHFYAGLYTRWQGWLLRRASTVLVSTPRYAERLAARGVRSEHVRVVPLGPGIGLGHPPVVSDDECPRGTAPGPDHPVIFVGGLDYGHSYKRPERLLEALANLRNRGVEVYAWIVGDGDRRADLQERSDRSGLGGQVRFLGRLTDAELACRLRSAWVLVLTSNETEGFGVVAVEAIHYGCPVLSSDGPGIGPLLLDSGAGMVYPRAETGALERMLEQLWKQPAERHRLAARTEEASKLFDWGRAIPASTEPIWAAAVRHAARPG